MTDEQIIKALDMCSNWENDKTCEECPANVFDFSCANRTSKFALSLIDRQKAEIERYRGVIKILENDVANAKCEAIKEFAERLKETASSYSDICGYGSTIIDVSSIDDLVKEMTEQNEK